MRCRSILEPLFLLTTLGTHGMVQCFPCDTAVSCLPKDALSLS